MIFSSKFATSGNMADQGPMAMSVSLGQTLGGGEGPGGPYEGHELYFTLPAGLLSPSPRFSLSPHYRAALS